MSATDTTTPNQPESDAASTPSPVETAPKKSLAERAREKVDAELAPQKPSKVETLGKSVRWLRRLSLLGRILLVVLIVGLIVYGVQRFEVVSLPDNYNRMAQLSPGQWLLIDSYRQEASDFQVGDFVLYRSGGEENEEHIALVAGLPGQTLSATETDGRYVLKVDGEAIADIPPQLGLPATGLGRIPAGHLFVLETPTDATVETFDSREFGWLPEGHIRGRIAMRGWQKGDTSSP